jgi:hypothetical protein
MIETALVALLTAGWALVRGTSDSALDDAGLFAGMALSLIAHDGAVAAAWRAEGSDELGERVLRSSLHICAGVALGLAQLLVLIALSLVAGDLAFILLGSALGCLVGGLALGFAGILVGLSIVVWNRLDPRAGVLARASMGLLLASIVVVGVGLGLGTNAPAPRARPAVTSLVLGLLGAEGDTISAAWLWIARAGAVSCVVWLVVLARAAGRHGIRATAERG